MIINAVSKFRQDEENIKKMAEKALGKLINDFSAKELAGGLCNAVYLVDADGIKLVLKIAPSSDVVMMRHEYNILKTEANVLKAVGEQTDINAPKLEFYDESCELCPSPYLFMSFIEGEALGTMKQYPDEKAYGEIKYEMGIITRKMCDMKADCFGIPAIEKTYCERNSQLIYTIFEMLFRDAADKNIEVPTVSEREMLDLVKSQEKALDDGVKPCYAHTDTWDGNLMIKNNKLSGLVDFAAIYYADPLMSHDFHDFSPEPNPEFLRGFGKTTFTDNELIRIQIYKIWQCLGMIVERGYRGYDDNRYEWVLGEYIKATDKLKKMINA